LRQVDDVKVLVTAGPTREALDPVRFISNRSSGKMGYAVAAAALRAGHEVRLISGPVAIEAPRGAKLVRVTTAEEMLAAVKKHLRGCEVLVMAAAVSDWRPRKAAKHKLKKNAGPPHIAWEATPDILKILAPLKKKSQVFCGFAAETQRLAAEAKRKLREKNLDAIAANDVSKKGRGFESDRNALTFFLADGRVVRGPLETKTKCAERLMDLLGEIRALKKK
jgi:phosphopantothenoylcysteine decarboxylase/phosphopantothenate--cysteine ligase